MKNALKVSVLLCLALVLITISACAASNNKSANKDPVTLKLFTSAGTTWGENLGLLNVIKAFEKANPTIKVQLDTVPNMEEVIVVRLATSDFPDITYYHTGELYMKSLKPEENLVELADLDINQKLVSGVEKWTQYQGKVYSVILGGLDVSGVIYNKDVFAKLGLTIPQTKDEFYATAEKLKAAGIIPLALGAKDAWSLQVNHFDHLASYKMKNPDWTAKLNANEAKFDETQAFVDTLALFKEMFDKGYIDKNTLSTTVEKATEQVATGQAGMWEMATWAGGDFAAKFPEAKMGMFANPLYSDDPALSMFATGGMMIFKKSKHIEESKKLLAFMASDEGLKLFYDENSAIPAYKDVTNKLSDISGDGNEYVKKGKATLDYKDELIVDISPAYENSMQELFVGKSAQDVAKTIQNEFVTNAKSQNAPGF